MEPVSSTAAAATTAVTSMDPPLQVLCRLWLDGGRASSDDTPPPPLTIPLSTRYTRCLVCDLEAKQWMQAVSRAAATCRGPTAASPETPPPTATAADVEPPYVVDWRARHRVAYWETVRQRQRQVAVEEEGTGRTSGTPERTAATAMADTSTAAALPQVVTLYRAHHLDAYDYAFFLCTILLFPVAWLIILFLYVTRLFDWDGFFWQCCGGFLPSARGCEQIVALDNGHVVCVRVGEARAQQRAIRRRMRTADVP
ncbi:hypothetical protein CDCA_CDCA01G0049 [Cyanidium caldarium]|uniref:Uncharacterized protein n=1 Tax=Cyanidium caldarium TaxID=2771 RepID=A0AAV9IP49_CYACA|nr:hypothetical protein CDCA_CDCA01G0049 [Cyanidium caldarium]